MATVVKPAWRATSRELGAIARASKSPLDARIKDTVIVLRLLGYKTIGSCAGHLDHGTGGPWIHLMIDDADELDVKLRTHRREFSRLEQFWLSSKVKRVSNTKLKQLRRLVAEFYKGRRVRADLKLHVYNPAGGFAILESRGVNTLLWKNLLEPRYSQKLLREYQAEMSAFTAFLKTKI